MNHCFESSDSEHPSSEDRLAIPGIGDPEEEPPGMTDLAFDSILEGFDQEALEADGDTRGGVDKPCPEDSDQEDDPGEVKLDRSPVGEHPPHEPGVCHEDVAEDGDDEAGEAARAPEPRSRRDLSAEATSLRHLRTHLPKNPYCVSCQQAKMRQRYSHR